MKLNATEMQRTLRRNLVQSEQKIADGVRQAGNLGKDEWPDDKLLEHTRRGLDQAVGWNLTTQEDIIGFLLLRHGNGERFDEFPAVRKFLSRTDLPPDHRMQLMMLELPMAIWEIVRRRTPPGPSRVSLLP